MLQDKKNDSETKRILNVILRNIQIGAYAPDNKLPSEAQMLKLYISDVYHIRKAVSILKKEGILYSIPKFGVFVKKETASQPKNDFADKTSAELIYSSRNSMNSQRELWNEVLSEYYNYKSPGIITTLYGESGKKLPQGDIYEYSQSFTDFSDDDFLNIKKYFPSIPAYPELMPDEFSIPVYYSTHILIYNENILKKLGFSVPAYRNFKEQTEYLESVLRETAKHPEYTMPGTAQTCRTGLGNYVYEMYSDLADGISGEAFQKKYSKVIHSVTDFRKNYPPPEPSSNAAISYNLFIEGKSPFYLGWSIDWIKLREIKPEFKSGGAMMYSVGDTILRIPMMLAVRKETKSPVECLYLARFLQKPEIRKKYTEFGMLPLLDEEYKDLPYQLVISPEKKGKADFLNNDEYYVCSNIINAELNNIALRGKPIKDAIADIVMFSRGYLRMKQEETQ